jgi:hypothetical protein
VPEQTSKQAHGAALSDIMLASARNVRAVLAGRSLSDSLGQTQAGLRAPAQAIAFHTMRHLGLARQIKQILLRRTPSSMPCCWWQSASWRLPPVMREPKPMTAPAWRQRPKAFPRRIATYPSTQYTPS